MNAVTIQKAALNFALSILVATLAFSVPWMQGAGGILFYWLLPGAFLAAGPGTALAQWILILVLKKRFEQGASLRSNWLLGIPAGLALGLLNILPTLALWNFCLAREAPLRFRDLQTPFLLGGALGGLVLAIAVLEDLRTRRDP